MNRNNCIDLFRLIAAFFIMFLHTSFGKLPMEYVENIRISARWGVPFFFMCTGYFLRIKMSKSDKFEFTCIEKNVVHLISILIVATIVNILFDIRNLNNFSIYILITSYFHLWFIVSLIIGYIFIWYIHFIGMNKFLLHISTVILLFALITDSYYNILHVDLAHSIFQFLLSIPFMYIGMIVSKKDIEKKYITLLVGISVIGFWLQYYEADLFFKFFNFSRYDHQLFVGTLIMVIPLFILTTVINIRENKFAIWGKKYSLFIYLYHVVIYRILSLIIVVLLPKSYGIIKIYFPLIGFITILASAIILAKYWNPVFSILNGNGLIRSKIQKTLK